MLRKKIPALVFISIVAIVAANVFNDQKAKDISLTQDVPDTLGVANFKGEWVIAPKYERIVHVRSNNSYWVKLAQSDVDVKPWYLTPVDEFFINKHWKCLDEKGAEKKSYLPADLEPVSDSYATLACGVDICSEFMKVKGPHGLGICDATGQPVTKAIYCQISDVGDRFFVVQEQPEKPFLDFVYFGYSGLGGGGDFPNEPLKLIDSQGSQTAVFPHQIWRIDRKFKDGLMYFSSRDGIDGHLKAINHAGQVVEATGKRPPPGWDDFGMTWQPLNSQLYCVKPGGEASKPLELISNLQNKGGNFYQPYDMGDNLLESFITNEKQILFGLADTHGQWVVKPIYPRLLYCGKDRIAASKNAATMEQTHAIISDQISVR